MRRIFFIIAVLLIAFLGLSEVAQPEIEMREIQLITRDNPQCTFYRANSAADLDDPLLIAYHHGAKRVTLGEIKPHITGFVRFSERVEGEKFIWTAGAGPELTLRVFSKSWRSSFFGYSLKVELIEDSKVDEQVNYSGEMRVKRRLKSEIIEITGSCEE